MTSVSVSDLKRCPAVSISCRSCRKIEDFTVVDDTVSRRLIDHRLMAGCREDRRSRAGGGQARPSFLIARHGKPAAPHRPDRGAPAPQPHGQVFPSTLLAPASRHCSKIPHINLFRLFAIQKEKSDKLGEWQTKLRI
jgi:hypothetical protein